MKAEYKERFFDPVHGFIHVSFEEKKLLEHPAFVRLQYLHQLGVTYLVYPGATHTRFEHSLGVMHVASRIYDQLFETGNPILKQALRLGALCHDLGHLPFSHTLEKQLLKDQGHEFKTIEIIEWLNLETYFQDFEKAYPGFKKLVLKIATSPYVYLQVYPDESYSYEETLLSSIVSGDYYGADRIDYLMRDSKSTGVSFGLFDYPQLIESLALSDHEGTLKIVLKEEGLHAVEGLLLARHYMHLRVYQHPAVLAYNAALGEFIRAHGHEDFQKMDPSQYIRYSDVWLSDLFIQSSFDSKSPGHKYAQILLKRKEKLNLKIHPHAKKNPGPLLVLSKLGSLEHYVPQNLTVSLFQKQF
jgi:HD superfamily phosphohydrolase